MRYVGNDQAVLAHSGLVVARSQVPRPATRSELTRTRATSPHVPQAADAARALSWRLSGVERTSRASRENCAKCPIASILGFIERAAIEG